MQKAGPFHLILGELRLPLDDADASQAMASRDFQFRFVYQRIPFSVTCRDADATEGALLHVTGDVGVMPFSAESVTARSGLKTVIEAANRHLGDRFAITAGRIRVAAGLPVPRPVTAVGIVSALTLFLLPVRPYLETIAVFQVPAPGRRDTPPRAPVPPDPGAAGISAEAER
ncbi:MAG: hypothetical protein F8N37_23790 [Telmatospirillum sp.]|nr:hypothetical protein [Telmatospirillum sp.]